MGFEKSFKQLTSMILTACVILASPGMALPQSTSSARPPQTPSATPSKALPPGGGPWPRLETYQGASISIYQPQIESWTDNKLDAYTAITIMPKDSKAIDYGVIWFTARTEVDKVNRVVALDDFKLTKQNFPSLPNNGTAYSGAFRQGATWSQAMPLDQLQSSLAVTPTAEKQQRVQVKNDPPSSSALFRLSSPSSMDNLCWVPPSTICRRFSIPARSSCSTQTKTCTTWL